MLCAAGLSGGFAAPATAAGVTAGSLIENTAQATYTANSAPQTVSSNTVTLRVDEVLDVAAVSQEGGPVSATTTAVLRYKVTNTGNGPEAFTLNADPAVSGNAFDAVVTGLAIDANGNGVYDPGVDTALANGAAAPALASDGALDVLVLLSIPAAAPAGATSRVALIATAVTGSGAPGTLYAGAGLGGGDAVVGASTARQSPEGVLRVDRTLVALVKSASISDPFGGTRPVPGAIITYRIVADVTGTGSAAGLAISDPIPAGSTYQAGTLQLDGAPLSDAADTDVGEASASGIAVRIGTLAAGAQRTVNFQVKIN
ncbi:DUF11 domain-containing protein [Qipengyuania sediminis]|uniref:DUF11 domain-containing protein n=1 Tax=Qipengyuania sediminis TaxID=1532023 RepID=UPI001F0FDAEC|nr:DUF11 domain-containing protein [Qipengyuania sediminis]